MQNLIQFSDLNRIFLKYYKTLKKKKKRANRRFKWGGEQTFFRIIPGIGKLLPSYKEGKTLF